MPTVDGLPYPNSSATPDVPGDMLLLVNALARKAGSGVARAADATGLAQLVTDGFVTDGMLAQQTDTKAISQRRSSAWLPPVLATHRQSDTTNDIPGLITQAGIGMIAGLNSTSINEAVTFPVPFATGTVPIVVLTHAGTSTGAFNPTATTAVTDMSASFSTPTATGFTAFIQRGSVMSVGTNYYYHWIAIGLPA